MTIFLLQGLTMGNTTMGIYYSHLQSIKIRQKKTLVCMILLSSSQKNQTSLTCSSSHSHRASPTLGSRASLRVGPTLAQGTRYYTRERGASASLCEHHSIETSPCRSTLQPLEQFQHRVGSVLHVQRRRGTGSTSSSAFT